MRHANYSNNCAAVETIMLSWFEYFMLCEHHKAFIKCWNFKGT